MLATAMLVLAPSAAAMQASPGHEQPNTRTVFYAPQVSLSDLIDYWSQALEIDIETAAGQLDRQVAVRSSAGMSQASFWAATNRILAEEGFACIQIPGEDNLSVVKLADAPLMARVETDLDNARAGYVRVIRYLEFVDPKAALPLATTVLAGNGQEAKAIPESDQLVLAGLKPIVQEALALVHALDQPGPQPRVLDLPLAHSAPASVTTALEQVRAARSRMGTSPLQGSFVARTESGSVLVVCPPAEEAEWRSLVTQFDKAEPAYTANYTPRRFGLLETRQLIEDTVGAKDGPGASDPWRIVTDDLTGTLIVTTTHARHREVEQLLARLESAPESASWAIRTFPVNNRHVGDMLDLLQALLEGGAAQVEATEAPEPTSPNSSTPAPFAPPELPVLNSGGAKPLTLGRMGELTLAADLRGNRLIAVGERPLLEKVEALVEELDVQQPQVMVEALVLVLTDDEERDLGVELEAMTTSGGTSFLGASLFGLGATGSGSTGVAEPVAGGQGFTGVVLDPGNYNVLLRALEVLSDGRTLNVPKVLVNNNEEASLDSVLQSPFASTNASNTVTTTSYGGTVDAGTSILVRPQIADADRLVIAYSVSLSTFTSEPQGPNVPPPRQENKLQSVVTVPDGYTVVLGGLEVDTQGKAVSQVPFLGDIPFLGAAFRSESTSTKKSRFYVFLNCNVLRDTNFEDLKYLSDEAMAEASLDTGWPTMEPKVIR